MPPETQRMSLKVDKVRDLPGDVTAVEIATVNGLVGAVVSNELLKNNCVEVDVVGRVGSKYYVRLPGSINHYAINVWVDEDQLVNDGW